MVRNNGSKCGAQRTGLKGSRDRSRAIGDGYVSVGVRGGKGRNKEESDGEEGRQHDDRETN